MSALVGLLIFTAVSTTLSVVLSEMNGTLSVFITVLSLSAGGLAGVFSGYRCRNLKIGTDDGSGGGGRRDCFDKIFDAVMGIAFFLFTYRFFFWMMFQKGDGVYTLDVNNFGDLPWHLTSITNLANSSFWPENPIFTGEKFHYPYGIDMFNALLLKLGVPLANGVNAVGLIGGALAGMSLYLWGRGFAMGAFLFSGGMAGFEILSTGVLKDYQAPMAWKNLPLALYLTQRGFLFALPAGLLLLWSWRRKFITRESSLPVFVEGLLWGLMPLFHVHTFIFLSFIFAVWVIAKRRFKDGTKIFLWALVPATYEMIRLTDAFKRASMIFLKPGWMIESQNPFVFFWMNYGFFVPLTLFALFWVFYRRDVAKILVIAPAAVLYGVCLFVMFAPWDWDNTKLMAWAYLMSLPVSWEVGLKPLHPAVRTMALVVLFFSGFICLYSAYIDPSQGNQIYSREQVDRVCSAMASIPHEFRTATAQTHNHPVLLCGHMVVAGYAGHLWSHGIPNHAVVEEKLHRLMGGAPDWKLLARELKARYIFWGPSEMSQFAGSSRPWEAEKTKIAEGSWGKIYDLGEQP